MYEAKPRLLAVGGVCLVLGATAWSLAEGYWTIWRSMACLGGAGLAIAGGAILQLRQNYRARSKWRRETRS